VLKILKYTHARTAFKIGLQLLGCRAGNTVLLPDFLCDVVWHPLDLLGLKVITYSLNDSLEPIWGDIEGISKRENIFALLMVHYFGQPQIISKYDEFCKDNNIFLIEDNAHGHGGYSNGKPMGSFGDFGFSSPRKFLNISFGGYLYFQNLELEYLTFFEQTDNSPYISILEKIKSFISSYPSAYAFFKSIQSWNIDWSDPRQFREKVVSDSILSKKDKEKINNVDWDHVASQRRILWKDWKVFSDHHGLKSVFPELNPESSPWAFPVYAKDLKHRDHWLKWGTKHGVPIFPWPALPEIVINTNGSALNRWERMLCFPLNGITPKRFI
jgi:hypothetical protein